MTAAVMIDHRKPGVYGRAEETEGTEDKYW